MMSSSEMPLTFDPLGTVPILHGDESMGLGTSTFLEGTPAARAVIQRREAEMAAENYEIAAAAGGGGLQRKKSLAQRIRGMNRGPSRDFQSSGLPTNSDAVYGSRRSPPADMPWPMPGATSSSLPGRSGERNPFFEDFEGGKKAAVGVNENSSLLRRTDSNDRTSSASPIPAAAALERRATTDATLSGQGSEQPRQQATGGGSSGGLLARVKSLKGGRRPPPPRPSDTSLRRRHRLLALRLRAVVAAGEGNSGSRRGEER